MITHLTSNGVSILTSKNGIPYRRAYMNDEQGRTAVQLNESEEVVQEIMKVWDAVNTEDLADDSEKVLGAAATDYKEKYYALQNEFQIYRKKYDELAQCIRKAESLLS